MTTTRLKIILSRIVLTGAGLALWAASALAQAPARRVLTIDDVFRGVEITDPQVSPEGGWVVYAVGSLDRAADKLKSHIWMADWEGKQSFQVTFGSDWNTDPRWSPDGRFLAFLSARSPDSRTQVWLLDRRGGEARRLTDLKEDIDGYEWSPDGKRLVAVVQVDGEDSEEAPDGKEAAPKPIVIDRYDFKRDFQGYLTSADRSRLYLVDAETGKAEALTGEKKCDESDPAWSPDGSLIAYAVNRADDPGRTGTSDICVVEARAGAAPRKLLTVYTPDRQKLAWSPDGRTLAFVQSFEPKYYAYGQERLAVIPASGGEARVLTAALDRSVTGAEFTPDGAALTFLVEDGQRTYLGKVAVGGGSVERLTGGEAVLLEIASGGGRTAVAAATDAAATEIYALEGGKLRKLTGHNDALFAELRLGAVEDMRFKSADGTEIRGLMVKPPFFEEGKKYPLILWIHGGPNMQDDHSLTFGLYPLQLERQLFAAAGYVVLAVNYRGSSGFGSEFQKSIFADWGNKEVADLLAAADEAVRLGVADPDRLGLGGWSYGGILTNYTIATDGRFKAAVSGAGSSNQVAMFGGDQYAVQYENELGFPWRNPDAYMKVSYPFFQADRIRTPTLFMGGEKDFNVPILGGEQMYLALRSIGVPTELVIYPGQYHLLTRPGYVRDRLERYLAWFGKYLKPPAK